MVCWDLGSSKVVLITYLEVSVSPWNWSDGQSHSLIKAEESVNDVDEADQPRCLEKPSNLSSFMKIIQ